MLAVAAAGVVAAAQPAVSATAPLHAVRAIEDRATGTRWLLAHDPEHPGGPGLLVPEGSRLVELGTGKDAAVLAPPPTVIRAGDRVVVEENTGKVAGLLEARALEPAKAGAVFRARIFAGGLPVHMVAVAPGRAVLAPEQRIDGGRL